MTNLFQLRNKLSSRILTPSQQINTKGRGRDNMEKDVSFDYVPATPVSPSVPSSPSSPTTTQRGKGMTQRGTPSGPPQFTPGGTSMFTPII